MAFLVVNVSSQNTILASPAERNRALRGAFQWIGDEWHRRYKMKKFRDSAMSEYGLTPRTAKYNRAKLRRQVSQDGSQAIGSPRPFVWSGRSRESAKASNKVVARAVRGHASADCIVVAPALNFVPKGGRIKLREEFERVSEGERREMEKLGIEVYMLRLSAKKYTRVRSYRG